MSDNHYVLEDRKLVLSEEEVLIEPMTLEGRQTLPAFYLPKGLVSWKRSHKQPPIEIYRKIPTLSELRHAYDTNDEVRRNVSIPKIREWVSTFLKDNTHAIDRPEKLFFDKKRGIWLAEGLFYRVELPPPGYITEIDKPSGWPSRTSENRGDAVRAFGENDVAYLSNSKNFPGIHAVYVGDIKYKGKNEGPFSISARLRPNTGQSRISHRTIRYAN